MSNGVSGRRLGFASFFADAKERPSDISTPARSPQSNRATFNAFDLPVKAARTSLSKDPHKGTTSESVKSQHKKVHGSKRNFKCIVDPELDKTLPKGSKIVLRYGGEAAEPIVVADPRKSRDYASKVIKGKKKYRPELRSLNWSRDENSVGPGPPSSVLVSDLSPLTTNQEIAIQFRSFGEMSETKLQVDPSNGASLGLCRITYRKSRSDPRAASEAARKAVSKMHGAKLSGQILRVEFDDDGKLCERMIKSVLVERDRAHTSSNGAVNPPTDLSITNKSASQSSSVPRGPKAMHSTARDYLRSNDRDASPRSDRDSRMEKVETKKYGKESSFRTRDMSKISRGTSETNKRLAHYAYIFIPGKVLPLHKVTAQELQIHFSGKKVEDIFTDPYGFYVLFDGDEIASRAHKTMDKSTFLGYRLYMELHKAKKNAIIAQDKPLGDAFKKTFQPVKSTVDPIMQATLKVVKELQEVFLRDLRSRIVGPALLEFLDPSNFEDSLQLEKEVPDSLVTSVKANSQPELQDNDPGTKSLSTVLSHIPRFKKKRPVSRGNGRMRVNHRMDHHALYPDESDGYDNEDDDDVSSGKRSHRLSSIDASIEIEEDGANTPMQKVKNRMKSRTVSRGTRVKELGNEHESDSDSPFDNTNRLTTNVSILPELDSEHESVVQQRHEVHFTSSEEDEEPLYKGPKIDEDDFSVTVPRSRGKKATVRTLEPLISPIAEFDTPGVPFRPMDHAPEIEASLSSDVTPTKEDKVQLEAVHSQSVSEAVHDISSSASDDLNNDDEVVLDLDGIQNTVKDDEDLFLLRAALEHVPAADIKNVTLWAWRHKENKAAHTDGVKGVIKIFKESGYNRVNATGSAKTEGYYQIPDIEKSFYLPNRNRAVVTEPGLANSSSRMNRANNRRQAAGIEAQRQTLEAQTDLLRFNALKSRKKQLKFSRSAIHDWGLYALEHIERGDMVIEYVGEIIRQQVADHREKRYERQGIGSSYLFRIDEDTVIDATKCGNIARFINHSCDPSCTAKIITVYGQKKIVIYAQRDIGLGEEITYDYKFPLEDEKIPCLCGSPICRKFLN